MEHASRHALPPLPFLNRCSGLCLSTTTSSCSGCRATGKSKGLAFVQYATAEAAAQALQALDGAIFQGRLLHLLPAHSQPNTAPLEQPQQSQVTLCETAVAQAATEHGM